MKPGILSVAALMALSGGFNVPSFIDSGPTYLPPNKKKTGALKQRRASKKHKRRAAK